MKEALEIINELRVENTNLRKRVGIDYLTQLPNREEFEEQFCNHIEITARRHQSLSLVILDIDHFKKVNDTHGHPGGDEVLRSLSAFAKKSLRPEDFLARIGGEEFAILLPQTGLSDSVVVIERLRRLIEQDFSVSFCGNRISPTVSAGIGEYIEGETPEDFFSRVDVALYEAKRVRNKVAIAA